MEDDFAAASELLATFLKGAISRREVLRYGGALGATAAAGMLLSACGGGKVTSTQATVDEPEHGSLNVLAVSGIQATAAAKYTKNFSAWYKKVYNQSITVTVTDLGYDPLYAKLAQASLTKSSAYDVVMMDYPWVGQFSTSGYIAALDEYVGDSKIAPPDFALDGYIPAVLDAYGKYGGKLFALPYLADVMMLYYREDLFKKCDVAVPETWDDFLAAGKQLLDVAKTAGGGIVAADALMGARGHENTMLWQQRYYSMLGTRSDTAALFSQNQKAAAVDNPTAVAALQAYIDALNIAPPSATSDDFSQTIALMQQGQVAMAEQWTEPAAVVNDPKSSKTAGQWKTALVPGTKINGEIYRTPILGGWSLAVCDHSSMKAAGFIYSAYMTFVNSLALAQDGITPARASVFQDKGMQSQNPSFATIGASLQLVAPRPRVPKATALAQVSDLAISQALTHQMSAESAIKTIQEQWNGLL